MSYSHDDFNTRYKVIIAGDSRVGKTSYFNILKNNTRLSTCSTVGVDFCSMTKKINNTDIKICLWDTAGQEKFKSIIRGYFREIAGAVLMFDLTDYSTFKNIKEWLKLIEHENKCEHKHPILLLGNKKDSGIRNVHMYDIKEINEDMNITYCEVSCIHDDDDTLEEVFIKFIEKINLKNNLNCKGIHRRDDDCIRIKSASKDVGRCC